MKMTDNGNIPSEIEDIEMSYKKRKQLANIGDIKDFFLDSEMELIQTHINNCKDISWDIMNDAYRDDKGILCISYGQHGLWYHYNTNSGEWW